MDPMQWLEQARNIRAAYQRSPNADPSALNSFRKQAQEYLGQQNQLDQQYPGRAIGGSGATGLLSNDAQGYSQMLNNQQARLGLQGFLKNGNPEPNVEYGGDLPSTRSLSQATGQNNSAAFGLPSSFGGAELNQLGTDTSSMNALRRYTGNYATKQAQRG